MNANVLNTSLQRKCSVCNTIKELSSEFFSKDKSRPNGFSYVCKKCSWKEDKRTWEIRKQNMTVDQLETHRLKNMIRCREYKRTVRGKAMMIVSNYANTDKNKNRECNITIAHVMSEIVKPCVYCGFPSSGLDRINNAKGHSKENCVPACIECNTGRMDNFTHEEMLIIGKAIRTVKLNRISKV